MANGGPGGAGDAYLNLASGSPTSDISERTEFTLPTSTLNLHNQSWAVSGWFNRTATTSHDMIFHFGTGDGFGGDGELYRWGASGGNNIQLHNYNPQDVSLSGAGLATGNWQSYVVNFTASGNNDGAGVLQFYLNGTSVGSDSTFVLDFNTSVLRYGGSGNNDNDDRNFDGGIDDFALYNTTLTQDQVTALHNRTATPLTVPEPSVLFLCGAFSLMVSVRRHR